jgi:hypothetical protein
MIQAPHHVFDSPLAGLMAIIYPEFIFLDSGGPISDFFKLGKVFERGIAREDAG